MRLEKTGEGMESSSRDPKNETVAPLPEQKVFLTNSTTTSEPAEARISKDPRSFGDHLKSLGAYAFILGLFGLGFTVSHAFWSSTFTSLQLDFRRSQDELTATRTELSKAKDELSKVKVDYARISGPALSANTPDQPPISSSGNSNMRNDSRSKDASEADVRIASGDTATLFRGGLTISLIGIEFKTNPSRYLANASVLAPGQELMGIKNAEVGYTADYPEKNGFKIQILSIDSFSARFLVKRF